MVSTLAILRQQGILKAQTPEQIEREKIQKGKDRWLADHRTLQLEMEQDKLRSRASARDQPTREYDNRRREQEEQKRLNDSYKNYKPRC